MKKTARLAVALIALVQIASAGQMLSYIAMPTGIGHATDAKGVRHPTAICMKDVLHAVAPLYPYYANVGCEPRNVQGNGMFSLRIDVNTGLMSRVAIIKSMGDQGLDDASVKAFKQFEDRLFPDAYRSRFPADRPQGR